MFTHESPVKTSLPKLLALPLVLIAAILLVILCPIALADSNIGGFAGALVGIKLCCRIRVVVVFGLIGSVAAFAISLIVGLLLHGSLPTMNGWWGWLALAAIFLSAIPGIVLAVLIFRNQPKGIY